MEGTVTGKKLVGALSGGGSVVGGVDTVFARDGLSAYEIAVKNGFEGTEQEWLESLNGEDGHFENLTEEQKASLKGEKGDTGNSGVYLGSGDMPKDCNVQIDSDGDVITFEDIVNAVYEKTLPYIDEQLGVIENGSY